MHACHNPNPGPTEIQILGLLPFLWERLWAFSTQAPSSQPLPFGAGAQAKGGLGRHGTAGLAGSELSLSGSWFGFAARARAGSVLAAFHLQRL